MKFNLKNEKSKFINHIYTHTTHTTHRSNPPHPKNAQINEKSKKTKLYKKRNDKFMIFFVLHKTKEINIKPFDRIIISITKSAALIAFKTHTVLHIRFGCLK